MVFCYKIITESPRRSLCSSPRKRSPNGRTSFLSNNDSLEGEAKDLIGLIPEHDWRLLAALARKREEEKERNRLAEEFQKMWLKEKEERALLEAETSEEYKRYLHLKRSQERRYQEYRRRERAEEQQAKRGQLLTCIRRKERRSADLLATKEDRQMLDLIDKAVREETKACLVADRRVRIGAADERRKQIELVHGLQKADEANAKRKTLLKDASQRLAINRALNNWETRLIRQEVAAQDAIRRASAMARCHMVDKRSSRLARSKATRQQRARALASLTAKMRAAIINDKYF